MWLEVAEAVFINELCEVPSESGGFELKIESDSDFPGVAVTMPRE